MRILSGLIALSLLLSGCSVTEPDKSGLVVSSQNYANIAKSLMGDNPEAQFEIHVLLANEATDPHEFEPSAQDKLAVSSAEAVLYAGTDFDSFVTTLLESVKFDANYVIKSSLFVAERNAACATLLCMEKGSNPHIWFDLGAVSKTAKALSELFIELRPEYKSDYEKANYSFQKRLHEIQDRQKFYSAIFTNQKNFFAPEAIANVMLMELGLSNAATKNVAIKISNEVELSVLEMQEAKNQILSQDVSIFASNEQVESVQAEELLRTANSVSLPVVYFSENSLCQNKTDEFLECYDQKITDIVQLLGVIID